jgi:hypothetical protein
MGKWEKSRQGDENRYNEKTFDFSHRASLLSSLPPLYWSGSALGRFTLNQKLLGYQVLRCEGCHFLGV